MGSGMRASMPRTRAIPSIEALARSAGFLVAGLGLAAPAHALQVADRVVISEVHYDPAEDPETRYEFIELYNAGTTVAYLDGAVVSDQGHSGTNEATFQFPGTPLTGTTLPLQPGAFVLLVGSATGSPYAGIGFEFYAGPPDTDHPNVPNLVKTSGLATDMQLGNAGDGIVLATGASNGNILPCAEIVDGVSWEDGGGANEVNALSRLVCADPAPHTGCDNSNLSLQRTRNGNDTDRSDVDFGVAVRTPGRSRPCLLDPACLELAYAPCTPLAGVPVAVTLRALQAEPGLGSGWLYYRNNVAASFAAVAMVAVGETLLVGSIPGQASQTRVQYYVAAADADGNNALVPPAGAAAPAELRFEPTSIQAVQGTVLADSCTSSAYVGSAVNVSGVVTHKAGEFDANSFYLQRGRAPYSGIRVVVPDASFLPTLGDSVMVSGTVAEATCETRIVLFPGCGQVLQGGSKVRARRLRQVTDVDREENEGMLVTLVGPLAVGSTWQGSGDAAEFFVLKDSSHAWVGADTFQPDGIGYSFQPVVGARLDSITGIVMARQPTLADRLARLRIEPRRDYDVDLDVTAVDDGARPDGSRVGPRGANPFRPGGDVEFSVPVAGPATLDVFDAAGRRVRRLWAQDVPAGWSGRVAWDGADDQGRALPSGLYFYRLRAGAHAAARKTLLVR